MNERQASLDKQGTRDHTFLRCESSTVAERELAQFIGFATSVLSLEPANVLRDIWLDELASMDRMPGPTSLDWRSVTVGATVRLATRLVTSGASQAQF